MKLIFLQNYYCQLYVPIFNNIFQNALYICHMKHFAMRLVSNWYPINIFLFVFLALFWQMINKYLKCVAHLFLCSVKISWKTTPYDKRCYFITKILTFPIWQICWNRICFNVTLVTLCAIFREHRQFIRGE